MRLWLPVLASAMLAGCGYPGEPMPPALNRPLRVADLAVVERGAKLYAAFTLPTKTSENLLIKTQPEIEIRVGEVGNTFVQAVWEQGAEIVPADAIVVDNGRVTAQVSTQKWVGKTVVIGVKLHGPKGRDLGWAVDVINVLPELPKPEMVVARDGTGGVQLEWKVSRPAKEFRVFRKLQSEKEWTLAGTSDKTSFLDTGVEYGKAYEYFVQAGEKTGEKYAESDLSETAQITPKDVFAPVAPTGLTAVPGTRSIELVWETNREADLAFYRVYRDNVLVADSVPAPNFSDRDIVAGAKHTYQVTAVDSAGNESPRSANAEATLP